MMDVNSTIDRAVGKVERRPIILAATDRSQRSEHAVQRAVILAQRLDAQLLRLHLIDPAQSERTIAKAAIESGADLIVLGPYRRRIGDWAFGTTAERVIRRARRPVLVVNGEAKATYEQVLLTSDLSPLSAQVARLAQDLGLLEGAQASIIHASEPASRAMLHLAGVGESEIGRYVRYIKQLSLHELQAQLDTAGLAPSRFSLIQEQGWPPRAIERTSQRTGSQLVVVGASRFPILKRVFLGSVSNEVLRTATRDVLLVSPATIRRTRARARISGTAHMESSWQKSRGYSGGGGHLSA